MGGGRAHPADAALADLLAHDAGPDFPRLRPRPRRSLAAIPAVLILAGLVAGSLLALVARRPPPVEEERAASVAPGLAGLTAVGPPVALSAFPTGVRERLSGVSDGRGVELLATRAGRSFFRARSSLGTCYLVANGAAPLIEPLAAACADGSLPAAARLVDLSPYSVRAGRPVLEAVGGVAADGVAAVAVLDAAGRTLLRIDVVDNVYAAGGTGALTGRALRLRALDAAGRTVADTTLIGRSEPAGITHRAAATMTAEERAFFSNGDYTRERVTAFWAYVVARNRLREVAGRLRAEKRRGRVRPVTEGAYREAFQAMAGAYKAIPESTGTRWVPVWLADVRPAQLGDAAVTAVRVLP